MKTHEFTFTIKGKGVTLQQVAQIVERHTGVSDAKRYRSLCVYRHDDSSLEIFGRVKGDKPVSSVVYECEKEEHDKRSEAKGKNTEK